MTAAIEHELQGIYDRIPAIACKGLCSDSCTVTDATPLERQRIRALGVDLGPSIGHSLHLALIAAGQPQRCPALSSIGTCRVYDVRPLICRLFGAAAGLSCQHGCVPDRVLSDAEAYGLIAEVVEISSRAARGGAR